MDTYLTGLHETQLIRSISPDSREQLQTPSAVPFGTTLPIRSEARVCICRVPERSVITVGRKRLESPPRRKPRLATALVAIPDNKVTQVHRRRPRPHPGRPDFTTIELQLTAPEFRQSLRRKFFVLMSVKVVLCEVYLEDLFPSLRLSTIHVW